MNRNFRDVVFEQHYANSVNNMGNEAFQHGRTIGTMEGISQALVAVEKLNQAGVAITPSVLLMAIQDQLKETQEQSSAEASINEPEIPEATPQEQVKIVRTPPKKGHLSVVK